MFCSKRSYVNIYPGVSYSRKKNILGGSQLSETELKRLKEDVPSLIPDENSGTCEPYSGTVCKQYIG